MLHDTEYESLAQPSWESHTLQFNHTDEDTATLQDIGSQQNHDAYHFPRKF